MKAQTSKKSHTGSGDANHTPRNQKNGQLVTDSARYFGAKTGSVWLPKFGDKEADCPLSTQTVDDFWRPKLATTNDKCHLSDWEKANDLEDNETLLRLISCEEVASEVASQEKNTAAGPDKVTTRTMLLSKETPCTLALLYNICMVAGKIPYSLKSNRTILILKGGDAAGPGNWRLITIGSLMLRIFTKVMGEEAPGRGPPM